MIVERKKINGRLVRRWHIFIAVAVLDPSKEGRQQQGIERESQLDIIFINVQCTSLH